jgi:2Fe-2S ferredoxin
MPLIFYTEHNGNILEVNIPVGGTLMQGAINNGISGILGQCGGNQSCATCHCYVDDAWIEKTGVAEGREFEMVAATSNPRPNSRLSCQIVVTDDMDGLIVRLPESQY